MYLSCAEKEFNSSQLISTLKDIYNIKLSTETESVLGMLILINTLCDKERVFV